MASYSEIEKNEIQEILDLYGLGEVQCFHGISHGISNTNYKIETKGQKFVLKLSNDKDYEQLKQEIEILNYLKEKLFIFVLAPCQLKNSDYVFQHKNFIGVLFPFTEGEVPKISASTCDEIGKALARLHGKTDGIDLPLSIRSAGDVGHDAESILDYLDEQRCPEDFKQAFNQVFPHGINHYLNEKKSSGIIHGDFYFDNSIFQGEFLKTMLDFEQGGKGDFLLDIGISISGTCLKDGKIHLPYADAFLAGYQSYRKIPENEFKHLGDATCLGLFSIALWRIKRFKEGNLDPSKADSYQELINRAIELKKS